MDVVSLHVEKWFLSVGKCLGLLVFVQTKFRKGTNILLVKGTAHTGTKETHVRTTMIIITSASSDVGRMKKFLKKKKQKMMKMMTVVCQ